jgi:hypothetical protein
MQSCSGVVPWKRASESCLGIVSWNRAPESCPGKNRCARSTATTSRFAAHSCESSQITSKRWSNRLPGPTPGGDARARLRGTIGVRCTRGDCRGVCGGCCRARLQGTTSLGKLAGAERASTRARSRIRRAPILGSFQRAAEELSRTQSAKSWRVCSRDSTSAPTRWQDLRPFPVRKPSRRDAKRLGQRCEYIDAGLPAVLDFGERAWAEVCQSGERRFRQSVGGTRCSESRAHAIRRRCRLLGDWLPHTKC